VLERPVLLDLLDQAEVVEHPVQLVQQAPREHLVQQVLLVLLDSRVRQALLVHQDQVVVRDSLDLQGKLDLLD